MPCCVTLCAQGLGKTLQTISLLAYLHEYRGIKGPHIVIVPKSTLGNWMNEFRRFCPIIRTIKFHGNAESRVSGKSLGVDNNNVSFGWRYRAAVRCGASKCLVVRVGHSCRVGRAAAGHWRR